MRSKSLKSFQSEFAIIVVAGGHSPEREISLLSGAAVSAALESGGFQTKILDPSEQPLTEYPWTDWQFVFNALHGSYGEDGQLQSDLDRLNVPYTGSDADSSWHSFRKSKAKARFTAVNLPTPPAVELPSSASSADFEAAASSIGYPLVIKPEAQGSSLGVAIIQSCDELLDAVKPARELDDQILIERAIIGEEWTVPILDDIPLPPIRITPQQQFFDYSAKYIDDLTRYEVIPQSVSETAQSVSAVSLNACQVLGTAGMCRVDVMVDRFGNPWLLEVNTSPGMTDHSLVPKSAAVLGWSMTELCQRILFAALPRFPNLQNFADGCD